jgi:5-methylthioadenosine/S-adenosylhomocysteine deaminase
VSDLRDIPAPPALEPRYTLLRNAAIYTGDAAHTCHLRGAMLIRNDRVTWCGPEADAASIPGALEASAIDLGGRVVMPGLINTHAHGGMGLHRGCCDDGGLFAWARTIAPHTSALTLEQARQGCELAVREMVRNGITTACDCTRYGAGIFSSVATDMGMRSLSGALANSPSLRPNGRPNWPLALQETLETIGQRRDDGLSRFYLGAHSPYSCTPELIVEVKQAAREHGLPFVIHAAECRDEVDWVQTRYGCSPIEWLHRLGVLDPQTLLAHCVCVDADDIERIAASGAAVSHNPVSNAKLASGIAPVPQMRARGIPVGLGTDSTLSNNALNLFQEMKFAVLLQRAHRLDATILTARDALRMATSEGGHALGWGSDIGSLAPGRLADLVVLDLQHPLGWTSERLLSDIVYAAGPQHVHAVMVGGQTIFEGGRFPRLDGSRAPRPF